MLDAPRGRGAEREGERGQESARGMPAPVPEESHDGEAAETPHSEHHRVEGPEARIRDEGREEKKRRREDERLRIGDLRLAGEDEWRPERPFAAMERLGEELELRIEMRLRVHGMVTAPDSQGQHRRSQVPAKRAKEAVSSGRAGIVATAWRASGNHAAINPWFGAAAKASNR